MKQEIRQAVQTACVGFHKVKITFKKQAIGGEVAYLLGMAQSGIISLDTHDEMNLRIANASGKWVTDNNRTIAVTLTDKFDESWFVERMYRALEKIEVVS